MGLVECASSWPGHQKGKKKRGKKAEDNWKGVVRFSKKRLVTKKRFWVVFSVPIG